MDKSTLQHTSFLSLFDKVVQAQPERIALAGDTAPISYAQLNQNASAIVARLSNLGVGAGAVLAIHTESRPLAIAAMIAVLRSGCAYLPLDPVYPAERLNYMVTNADTSLVISDNDEFVPEHCERLDLRQIDFSLVGDLVSASPLIDDASDAYII